MIHKSTKETEPRVTRSSRKRPREENTNSKSSQGVCTDHIWYNNHV